jgi:hypothetical protein
MSEKKIIKVERGVNNSLTCLHAGKLACQKKRARQLANWQASQLAPTLKPPINLDAAIQASFAGRAPTWDKFKIVAQFFWNNEEPLKPALLD